MERRELLRQAATRWKQRSSVGVMQLLPANVSNLIYLRHYKLLQLNYIPTAEITAFFFFFSLMNKLVCLFKCLIAVYDIVMDLESIIISLLKNKLDST